MAKHNRGQAPVVGAAHTPTTTPAKNPQAKPQSPPPTPPPGPALRRDQQRAQYAYVSVAAVPAPLRKEYRTLVHGLGAQIVRSGLMAAMAFLERNHKDSATRLLLTQLLDAGIPGLSPRNDPPAIREGADLPRAARALPLAEYMLATRETLKVLQWFKRAVQATFTEGGTAQPENQPQG